MYKCQKCRYNNNGWCNIKRFNGLKKKNIQECEDYKVDGTEFTIIREKDGLGTKSLTISIDDNEVFIPEKVIADFINGSSRGIKVEIPR